MKFSNSKNWAFYFLALVLNSGLQAQVPVHKEPRHRPIYENADIRILDVHLPPGDTSLYHIHNTPSLFIFFTNTANGSQLQGKTALTGKYTAGNILFENLAAPNTRIHRVWNADKDTLHVMDIEILFKDSVFTHGPLALPDLKLERASTWARVYRLSLSNGKKFILNHKPQSFILVSLQNGEMKLQQNGKSKRQAVKPGSFFNIKRRQSFSIENTTKDVVEFCLLELPR